MINIRVRVAPSPTGNLHVGTARTALFNELLARQQGGKFIIRLEDTDKERSKKEFEENILEGLRWLGLTWDEGPDIGGDFGPYRQSERTAVYTAALQQLLDQGKAKKGEGETIVLLVEPQEVVFKDEVRGEVKVHTDSFGGNFIIARSLTDPLFHLAVVVDDEAMKITHVIRGEDHLHNTVKHILIQRALGYATPSYAHLPLLLDEKRAKLSKRSGETSLLVYRDRGYLPEAMLNYLALLGWNPKNDREFFSHQELVEAFNLSGVQKAGAVFSMHKLDSVNKYYLQKLSPQELCLASLPFLEKAGITTSDTQRLEQALTAEQPRAAHLTDLASAVEWVADSWPGNYETALLIWKKSDAATTKTLLEKMTAKMQEISEEKFTENDLEKILLEWIDEEDMGRGDTLWPLRVALTGRKHSPGPFEVASILGKGEVARRLLLAQEKFGSL
ncbi:MAG: glutamate--tRNA ligase [Candidatus Andersenbacteria bacterium]|nr:glutamate--tRNA ligase [Candidatus Andersenbacteria bacterium]MBI3250422.1 glutamate--tRNA ligase [Candidatus Andersenbacteria bacterium]